MRLIDADKVVRQLEDETDQSYTDFVKYADNVGITEDDDWHYMGLKRAIEIIKATKQSERKNGWIPISERVPENDNLH